MYVSNINKIWTYYKTNGSRNKLWFDHLSCIVWPTSMSTVIVNLSYVNLFIVLVVLIENWNHCVIYERKIIWWLSKTFYFFTS